MRQAFAIRLKPGNIDRLSYSLENDVIVIGWSKESGLLKDKLTRDDFVRLLERRYYSDSENRVAAGKAAVNMWRFIHDLAIDDLVFVPSNEGVHIAEVVGPIEYDPTYLSQDMAYRRNVHWITKGVPIPWSKFPREIASEVELRQAVSRDITDYLASLLSILASHVKGQTWTKAELRFVVQSYFEMLSLEQNGEHYVKKNHRKKLVSLIPRGEKSIEFKYQNVSAVLASLGLQYIDGYKPKDHIQLSLVHAVESHLAAFGNRSLLDPDAKSVMSFDELSKPDTLDQVASYFVDPPLPSQSSSEVQVRLRAIASKLDYQKANAKKKALGDAGEAFVFELERRRLAEHPQLANKVKWLARDEGDGIGYDVHSYNSDGTDLCIEVKTTNGGKRSSFFISNFEYQFAANKPECAVIYRVYNFSKGPKIFVLKFPFEDNMLIEPHSYKFTPK